MSKERIFPRMAAVSNNSNITRDLAKVLAEKLTSKELEDLLQWTQLVEQRITDARKAGSKMQMQFPFRQPR